MKDDKAKDRADDMSRANAKTDKAGQTVVRSNSNIEMYICFVCRKWPVSVGKILFSIHGDQRRLLFALIGITELFLHLACQPLADGLRRVI